MEITQGQITRTDVCGSPMTQVSDTPVGCSGWLAYSSASSTASDFCGLLRNPRVTL
jgi:hypothetical protein